MTFTFGVESSTSRIRDAQIRPAPSKWSMVYRNITAIRTVQHFSSGLFGRYFL